MATRKIKSISFQSKTGDTLVFEQDKAYPVLSFPPRIDLRLTTDQRGDIEQNSVAIEAMLRNIDIAQLDGYYFVLSRRVKGKWVAFCQKSATQIAGNRDIDDTDRPNPIPIAANDSFSIRNTWAIQYFKDGGYSFNNGDTDGMHAYISAKCSLNGQKKQTRGSDLGGGASMMRRTIRFNVFMRVELRKGNTSGDFANSDPLLISNEFTLRCAYRPYNFKETGRAVPSPYIWLQLV